MERSEPSFVPEWYKGSSSTATGSSISSNCGSLLSATDEHNSVFSSRDRLSVSVCDHDAPHRMSSMSRTSFSFQRSASNNVSVGWEREFPSRGYNNCGWIHRDKDRDREKDLEILERDRPLFLDNGFSNYPDSFNTKPSEKDFLRRSQSLVSGRRFESWPRRPAHDSSNDTLSSGSMVASITKSSFERDFPSLGAEEKHLGSDLSRVSSPGINTAVDILPLNTSASIGGDGWTSALAEVPAVAGGNGQLSSSAVQTGHTTSNSSTITGLNMAETLAQVPERVRTVIKPPKGSQKIEELHRQQILKLRPVTPSMLKSSVPNLADKSKTKGTRVVEFSSIKRHSSPPLATHASVRPEASKTSLPAQFRVLNRGRNGFSPYCKDCPSSTNFSRLPTTSLGAANPPSKDPINPKVKVDIKGGDSTLRACGEKRTPSLVQKRSDFFNSLRMKTSSACQPTNTSDGRSCDTSSSSLQKPDEPIVLDSTSAKQPPLLNSSSVENRNCSSGSCCAFEEPEKLAPNEEEAAFLRSLGWEENAGEEALTREEIESFLSEYEKLRPASKLNT